MRINLLSQSIWADITEDHSLGLINNSYWFLTVWRLEVQDQALASSGSDEILLSGS